MDTLGVVACAVLPLSFGLAGAEVDFVDEQPDSSMAATATPETPKLNLFIVFIHLFPLIFYFIDGYAAKR